MTRNGVTYQAVSDCAAQLLAEGIQPSVQLVRKKMGSGTKASISKHLKRWVDDGGSATLSPEAKNTQNQIPTQTQAPIQNQALLHDKGIKASHKGGEDIPQSLLMLIKGFWQTLNQEQSTVLQNALLSAQTQPAETQSRQNDTPSTASETSEKTQEQDALQEHVILIQEYVSGLERELAETTATRNRLAARLEALFDEPSAQHHSKKPSFSHKYKTISPMAWSKTELTPCPLISELKVVCAGLQESPAIHGPDKSIRSAPYDCATVQAIDEQLSANAAQDWLNAMAAKDKQNTPLIKTTCRYLSAALIREQSLEEENSALVKQIRFLQNKFAEQL